MHKGHEPLPDTRSGSDAALSAPPSSCIGAQLLTYLRLSGRRLGFLINFNVVLLKQGIKRMIL